MTAKRKATPIVISNYTLFVCVYVDELCASIYVSLNEWENKHARHKISSSKQIIDVISSTSSTAKIEKLNQYYDFG